MITPLIAMTRDARAITGEKDATELREFADLALNENDFEFCNYRFIRESNIDEIMRDELESDEYVLGCFNAWFIADILGTSTDAIEAMQNVEAFEGIGKMIIANDKLDALQQAYVSADGYGHHFGHYDGNEYEVGDDRNRVVFYAFRIN